MPIVVSDQIQLSEIRAEDESSCIEYLQEPAIYAVTLRIPSPYSPASFQGWLKILGEHARENQRHVVWAIRNPEGRMIGACGLDDYRAGVSHKAELGYWLARPYWGRGIMTAVVERVCEVAFTELGLAKVVAHTFAENGASARVLEKCRFRQEGLLRQHLKKDGRLIDARAFGRLRGD